MLEVGQIFKKNGFEYCLLEIISFENKEYALFSKQKESNCYEFYEILKTSEGYNFKKVEDEILNFKLLEMFEKEV